MKQLCRHGLVPGLCLLSVLSVVGQEPASTSTDPLIEALQKRLDRLEAENRELRGSNEELREAVKRLEGSVEERDGARLEEAISAVLARHGYDSALISAANPVTLTGELRFRMTGSAGDNLPILQEEHDGYWVDSLVRLGFQYEFTRDVTALVEMQAHWSFGQESSTRGFGASILVPSDPTTPVRVHQAWLEARQLFGLPELSARIGRQEILLGRQFQFGNAEWYNGFSFDALVLDWSDESFRVSAIAAKLGSLPGDINQIPAWFLPHDDDELYSIYATFRPFDELTVDLYWIYINAHGLAAGGSGPSASALPTLVVVGSPGFGGTAYYHTIGARAGGVVEGIAGGLDWNIEGAYQFGDANDGTGGSSDIDAGTVEAELGLTLDAASRFRIYTRFLYADQDYIVLYPNRHMNDGIRARYGIHDLIPMFNVITAQVGLHFDPAENATLGATVLWAKPEDDLLFIDDDEDYGWEIDLWGEYRYSNQLVFGAGLAIVLADEALQGFLPIDDDTQFLAYLQARLLF